MSKKNLDLECARVGRKIVKERKERADKNINNVVENSLGILQEDGVYAFYVYLFSEGAQNEGNNSNVIAENTWKFLGEGVRENGDSDNKNRFGLGFIEDEFSKNNVFDGLQENILDNLNRTFFTKEILEKILIYARYNAKALNGSDEDEG